MVPDISLKESMQGGLQYKLENILSLIVGHGYTHLKASEQWEW